MQRGAGRTRAADPAVRLEECRVLRVSALGGGPVPQTRGHGRATLRERLVGMVHAARESCRRPCVWRCGGARLAPQACWTRRRRRNGRAPCVTGAVTRIGGRAPLRHARHAGPAGRYPAGDPTQTVAVRTRRLADGGCERRAVGSRAGSRPDRRFACTRPGIVQHPARDPGGASGVRVLTVTASL